MASKNVKLVIMQDDAEILIDEICSRLEMTSRSSFFDLDTAEFSMDYDNRVILETVDIDTSEIADCIQGVFEKYFHIIESKI